MRRLVTDFLKKKYLWIFKTKFSLFRFIKKSTCNCSEKYLNKKETLIIIIIIVTIIVLMF